MLMVLQLNQTNNRLDPEGLTWDAVETKVNELKSAEPMKLLREERDRLIAETDWWASSDLTMTEENKLHIVRHFVIFQKHFQV